MNNLKNNLKKTKKVKENTKSKKVIVKKTKQEINKTTKRTKNPDLNQS